MKALVYTAPNETQLREMPMPELVPGEEIGRAHV